MNSLLFIDTNIWLDFYRITGREGDLSVLAKIDANHDKLISTAQVEMEFKKNRQKVIVATHAELRRRRIISRWASTLILIRPPR